MRRITEPTEIYHSCQNREKNEAPVTRILCGKVHKIKRVNMTVSLQNLEAWEGTFRMTTVPSSSENDIRVEFT